MSSAPVSPYLAQQRGMAVQLMAALRDGGCAIGFLLGAAEVEVSPHALHAPTHLHFSCLCWQC